MRLKDFIQALREIESCGHENVDVRLAIQPHYPFEHSIDGFCLHQTHKTEIDEIESFIFNNNYPEDNDDARERLEELQSQNEVVLYIREGGQIGSISRDIWDD